MIEVEVAGRLGPRFVLDVRFATEGGLTALFGRSGAGKTSVVNMVAGLARPERGRIAVDGVTLLDTERGVFVPAHRRRIGYVFQEARLFPHLTVRGNLLFGRWFTPRSERYGKLDAVVDLLGIDHLLDRRPGRLSGGERQRVAIGRALLASPRLLLMDEPLASLDGPRKEEILPYIERLRDEIRVPIIYVSHAVPEVARLATTLVLMSEGRVEAVGSVSELFARLDLYPLTGRFEAGAVLKMHVAGYEPADGLTLLRGPAGELLVPRSSEPHRPGTPVRVRIRARDVILAVTPPQGLSALNILQGRIAEIAPGEPGGAQADVRIALGGGGESLIARVTRRSIAMLGLEPGRDVYAVIKTVAFDRRSLGWAGEDSAGGRGEEPADV
jgi:molybdate transport system ATP-binding protein